MLTTLLIYRPDRSTEILVVGLDQSPGLTALSAIVRPLLDGADMEHVSVLFQNRRTDMFVDEMGARRGLPINEEATAIYRAWTLINAPLTPPDSLPAIHGPAVLFKRIVWS